MPDARWSRTEAINHQADRFDHIRKLEDAEHLNGGAPNNDTLYSRAWVFLKEEPVILSVPDVPDRYYTMEIVDFMGDNFAYVGQRTTGSKAGNYAIVGPDWRGRPARRRGGAAAGDDALGHDPRTDLREGPDDLASAHAIQDQYKLTPLSQWGKADVTPTDALIWEAFDPKTDPLAEWKTINRAMVEAPPLPRDADIVAQIGRIGIGPGLDVEAQDESTRRGLARAAVDGKKIIAAAFADGYLQSEVNGWSIRRPRPGGRRRRATGCFARCRCWRVSWRTTPKRRRI